MLSLWPPCEFTQILIIVTGRSRVSVCVCSCLTTPHPHPPPPLPASGLDSFQPSRSDSRSTLYNKPKDNYTQYTLINYSVIKPRILSYDLIIRTLMELRNILLSIKGCECMLKRCRISISVFPKISVYLYVSFSWWVCELYLICTG